tara:strand:+ start:239 stop:1591 length:1353 start_codon:yes stop_codon:yes gene_type:complete
MKALSQSEYGEIRSLYESIYAPQVDEELELSDEELEDIVEEVVSDLLEEGYDIDDIEEGFNDYIEEDFQFLNEARAARKAPKGSKSYDEVKAGIDAKEAAKKKPATKKKPASTGMGAIKTSTPSIPSTKNSPEKKTIASRLKGAVKRVVGGKKGAERVTASDRRDQKSTRMSPVRAQKNSRVTIGSEDKKDLAKRKAERNQNRIDKKIKSAQGDSSKSLKARVSTGVKKATDTAKDVKSRATDTAKRVKAGAQIAGIVARDSAQNTKDSAVRAKRRAELAGSKAVTAVKNAPGNIKKGIKGKIASGLQKVSDRAGSAAKRMSEEVETYDVVIEFLCDYGIAEDLQEAQWLMVNEIDSEDIESILEAYGLDELYKGKHGQTEKQYQDGRSMAGKMVSGDSKGSGANYAYRAKNTGPNPAGGSVKPQGQARMSSKDRAYLNMQKANFNNNKG